MADVLDGQEEFDELRFFVQVDRRDLLSVEAWACRYGKIQQRIRLRG